MKRHEAGFLDHASNDEERLEQALEQCEATLESALRGQLGAATLVGRQLAEIRNQELYRAAGCQSFEAYCRKFLGLTREQVRRYLQIAEVVEALRTVELELPASEAQAVMLARIPRDRLTFLWQTVLAHCAREQIALTDGIVRQAVRLEIAPKKQISSTWKEKSRTKFRAGVKVILDLEAEKELA